MTRYVMAALIFALAAFAANPAQARTVVFVGASYGCCGYYHHGHGWGHRWGYWGGPAYYPYYPYTVYAPPVVYAAPAVTYISPPVVSVPAASMSPIAADQTSPTYTDSAGQTCREFQTTGLIGGDSVPIAGTACLQPDGAWRVMR